MTCTVIDEVRDLYRIIRLRPMRRTKGVCFDVVDLEQVVRIDAVDRVIHAGGAFSPGSVGGVERPWYMHPHQADNLLVLHGVRYVEIYTPAHGRIEQFTVTPDKVMHGAEVVCDGGAMLVWPCRVFHRIISDKELGSASVNLATHFPGFDIDTNFSIYDVDTGTGEYRMIRKGSLDQQS